MESVAVILTHTHTHSHTHTHTKTKQQQQQKSTFLLFGAAEEARGTTEKFVFTYNNTLKQFNRFQKTSAHLGRLHS